jgi:tRNA(Ile)-lysidine synthase
MPCSRYRNLYFIRPLIEIDKKSIIDWLERNNKQYKIDKTNLENIFFRNRIRNQLMPYLQKFNPAIEDSLFNLAATSAVDYDFIYQYCYRRYQKIRKISARKVELNLDKLRRLHPAVVTEIIRIAIEEVKGNLRKLELKHFQEIIDLLKNRPSGSIVSLPELIVKKRIKVLVIKSLLL